MAIGDICITDGCNRILSRRGKRCNRCWYLKQYYGSHTHHVETREEFFMRHVKKTECCWFWLGRVNKDGYGSLSKDRTDIRVHRFSWELFTGSKIPDGLHVLHKCDIRNCVNPDHLFLGTHTENMKDMSSKKRYSLKNRKLSDDDIKTIKKLLSSGERNCDIATKFNMDRSTISNIRHGKHWRDV